MVSIKNGTFSWDRSAPTPTLQQIHLDIKQGTFCAIVGATGSAKSSLLAALLREMSELSGTSALRGSVAYVPQVRAPGWATAVARVRR